MANNELFDLFSETDDLINNYLRPKEWQGSLPMQFCRIIHRDAEISTVPPESKPIDLFDFCKYGKQSTWYTNSLIRFDPTIYRVPKERGDLFGKGSSGHQLITDLLGICHCDGKSKFSSYGCHNGKNSRCIVCHHFICHNSLKKDEKVFVNLALRSVKSKSTLATS